jgi:hypothetical protein
MFFSDCFGLRLPMTKSHNRPEYRKGRYPFSTALVVIAMSEAKKQSRIYALFFWIASAYASQ